MPIGVLNSLKHINCYELYSANYVSPACPLAVYYSKIKIN
jgi:hypothetical protein